VLVAVTAEKTMAAVIIFQFKYFLAVLSLN
jgi:hypothetical protein